MRTSVFALLALAACASAPKPDAAVRGCWISREGAGATTMRWLPDRQEPGRLNGDMLVYGAGEPQARRFALETHAGAWRLCEPEAPGAPCWAVAQGRGGAIGEGPIFISGGGERLRIVRVSQPEGGGALRHDVIFAGRRDGCD